LSLVQFETSGFWNLRFPFVRFRNPVPQQPLHIRFFLAVDLIPGSRVEVLGIIIVDSLYHWWKSSLTPVPQVEYAGD